MTAMKRYLFLLFRGLRWLRALLWRTDRSSGTEMAPDIDDFAFATITRCTCNTFNGCGASTCHLEDFDTWCAERLSDARERAP